MLRPGLLFCSLSLCLGAAAETSCGITVLPQGEGTPQVAAAARALAATNPCKLVPGFTSKSLGNVWASYLARELQRARLRSEILSLKTVAQRLDAWIGWNGGRPPEKGEWKFVASQIGVSPEALYREIAKRRD